MSRGRASQRDANEKGPLITTNQNGSPSLASRVDSHTRTDVGFVGEAAEASRLFVSISTPLHAPQSGIVICPPLHADFAKNYRNEVLLARALSRQGHAVLRFHYRGQGHSDGDPRRMSLDSLTEDALTAVDLLRSMTGVARVGLVGTRLGGFIAAAAAASHEMAPLALWEPVLEPAKYMREAIRARMTGGVTGSSERVTAAGLNDQLLQQGFLDIYGYPIHLSLVQSLEGKELQTELGSSMRPILLVQISRGRELRSDYASFSSDLSSLGLPVSVHHVTGTVGWWFRGGGRDRDQPDVLTDETVAKTVEWLGAQFDTAEVPQ